jgi:pimeloyl-ACP methyl ester carboxylesterase
MNELLLPSGTTLVVPTDDGAELAVTDLGTGPTVVLAHGWTEQREVWAPVVRRLLDAGHRVVLYDQRGHGSSTTGSDGCTIPRLGRDLRAVLEAVDARDAVLAGHSMGGMTIMSLATEHPEVLAERARGLVLVATAASGLSRGRLDRFAARLMASRWFIALYRSPLGPRLVRRTFGTVIRREHLRLTRDLFVACTPAARRQWFEAMGPMDLRPCLPAITLPTVVMVGTLDRLTPPHHSDALVAAIPGARLVSFDELGHQLPLEAAHEVAEAIRSLTCSMQPISPAAEGAPSPAGSH